MVLMVMINIRGIARISLRIASNHIKACRESRVGNPVRIRAPRFESSRAFFVGLGQNTGGWERRKSAVLVAQDQSSDHGGILRGKTALTPSEVIVATHHHVVSTVMRHVVRHFHRRKRRNALRRAVVMRRRSCERCRLAERWGW